ncbi:restriction endonuclease S subunit [Brooklawnia cerclae]|uniref:Restriction endonuclease S subunit n=2 Tax=Brooklawnia cerclae TaxID=349934 RepID=A0ABX0SMI7_9ACTN|nr:restriction endonuclease S subunit [Brooklawnia cerclae]
MNPHFVCAVLNSRIGQDQIDSFQAGGNRQGLNFQQVGSIEIPMPRIGEQDAIAEALTDADGLIYSLRELIAKKRAIKQGMMQELLTGRTRLPGFAGAWTPVIFGDIATPSKERSDPSVTSGRVVELEHISARTGRLIGDSDLASSVSLKTRFLKGDVLFGKLRAYLRKYWLADRDGYASTEIWALRPRTGVAISAFLRYVVEQDDFIEAASTAYGTHMPRSDWKVVSRYELELPTLDEQAAIGLALQSSDAEIAALERRLEATRDIKQSMMQELLTGRTRLVPTEASA